MRRLVGVLALVFALTACGGEAETTVPDVVPDYAHEAVAELVAAGFRVEIADVPRIARADRSVNGYAVVAQNPVGGARAQAGSVVRLMIGTSVNAGQGGLGGEGILTIPELTGMSVNLAIGLATESGLYAGVEAPKRAIKSLVVRGQSPGPGEQVQAGSEVKLTLE